MLRWITLFLMCLAVTVTVVSEGTAAPQDPAEMQKALEQIEKSGMPEDAKRKAREQIQKQMAQKRGKPGGAPPKDAKKDADKKKPDDKKEDAKESNTVKRPDKPKKPADPKELEATPVDGKIVLQFQGQPWTAMVDWYSRVTGRQIEWQELPGGFVNLRTQQAMTLDETGDMLNRLLLARGFTMLDDGGFLQIVKTEAINPAFVPRVDSKRLATMMPHAFVRTSFQLMRFKADEIVKELEAMKSKHGKLTPMVAANRIEAMDMVVNLRDIYIAIDQEQSSGVHAPREFEIHYLRAEVVKEKLEEMLGVAKQKSAGPMSPQQMQQMMQRRQMQQQQQQKGGKPPGGENKEEKISIIVNELKNSVIVKAPPHKLLDIADAIKLLDVQPNSNSLDIKAYTLATRGPQELADMLNESGALSPTAIVRIDKKTKTLLVSGNEFDHFKIQELIKRIDGNARRFVSIRLRKYPALQVAGTIEKMMGEPEDDSNSRRRYYWWDNNDDDDDDKDTFRVTADIENNRLILKCNDAEYEMVMDLLTQMGEILTRSQFAVNEITLEDIAGDVGEDELLRRVKAAFETYAPNEVVLPPEKPDPEPVEDESEEDDPDDLDAIGTRTASVDDLRHRTVFTQVQFPNRDLPDEVSGRGPRGKKAPPIVIERNSRGKLVIRSEDPKALEMFEELMRQMAPKSEDWVHFKLTHVTAYWMKVQLEDFFEDDDDSNNGYGFFFFDYYGRNRDDKSTPGLGEERQLKFIDDGESTLVVRNASPKQLATIERLIKLYDVQEPPNEQSARYKQMIPIKFSKARIIETALKDAFRDLLSSNDKAFAEQNKGKGEDRGGSRRFYGFGYGYGDDDDSGLGSGSTFKGKLSFGVDDTTNTLIVTAQGKSLLQTVVEMVKELDQAAVPNDDTRVVSLPAKLNSAAVRETLAKMFGPDAVTEKPNQNPDGQEGNQQGKPGQGNPGRGQPKAD